MKFKSSNYVCLGLILATSVYVLPVSSQENDSQIEEVTVNGYRASIESAKEAKREGNTVIEAITPAEIGMFVDNSIADAMKRVPGVQIEEDYAGTDGDRVSIRGLGSEFVNSTINGRTLLSSGNEAKSLRKMNFNMFPSSVLSGVRITKGQTAAGPEGGLAGQVDLQTARPLDLKQLEKKRSFGLVTLRAEHRDLYDDDGNRTEFLFGTRNEDSTLGGFFAVVAGESDVSVDQVSQNRVTKNLKVDNDGDGISDGTINGVNVPNATTSRPTKQTMEREAISGGVQWRPSDELELVWDLTYAKFDNESSRINGQIIMNPVWGAPVFDAGGIVIDSNNTLLSADFSQTTGGGKVLSRVQEQLFDNVTENLVTGLNVDFTRGQLNTNFDIYLSKVDYEQDLRFPIFNANLTDKSLINYDGTGDLPLITTGPNRLDPTKYAYLFSIVRQIELEGENHGVKLSFNWDLEGDVFSDVDFGLHYEDTSITSTRSKDARFSAPAADRAGIVAAALTGVQTDESFISDEGASPNSWLAPSFEAVGELHPGVLTTGMANLGIDPAASHDSEEAITSLYGQLNLNSEFAGKPLTGNIGVRAVHTDHSSTAGTVGVGSETVPVTTGNDYWELLPNINLNLALRDDVALRFGLSKTLSRPSFQELAPIIQVNIATDPTVNNTAKAGNPDLDPMTSLNFDVTLEWYRDNGGSAVVSVFHKEVSDFIISNLEFGRTVPGQPTDTLFDTTQPVNFSDGEAKGFEVGFDQPFDEVIPALKGFGLTANYTYVDSSFDEDVGDSGFGFPGSSENNYNIIGYFENEKISARLAYVFRDEFFRSLAGQGSQTSDARFTSEFETLDFNLTVRPVSGLSVALNASNLTDERRRDHIGDDARFLDYFAIGRTFALTTTYRF